MQKPGTCRPGEDTYTAHVSTMTPRSSGIIVSSRQGSYHCEADRDTIDEQRTLLAKKARVQEQMADNIVELADYTAKESSLAGTGERKAVEQIVSRSSALTGNQAAINRMKTGIKRMNESVVRKDLTNQLGSRFGQF